MIQPQFIGFDSRKVCGLHFLDLRELQSVHGKGLALKIFPEIFWGYIFVLPCNGWLSGSSSAVSGVVKNFNSSSSFGFWHTCPPFLTGDIVLNNAIRRSLLCPLHYIRIWSKRQITFATSIHPVRMIVVPSNECFPAEKPWKNRSWYMWSIRRTDRIIWKNTARDFDVLSV